MIVLDTHTLVWAVSADRKLGRRARALIDAAWPRGEVAVSAISFWEIAVLAARRRLRLRESVGDWRSGLLAAGLDELPIDGAIAVRATELEGLPGDPADRFIVASALQAGAEFLTADENILGWRHTLVRFDARA